MLFTAVLIFYASWIILTCVNQFYQAKKLQAFLEKLDLLHILPGWTFFAPNPGTSDYHLLYRVKNKNGDVSPFTSVKLKNQRQLLNAIWNPNKRAQKALTDFVQEIRMLVYLDHPEDPDHNLLRLSLSYIATLHYCTALGRQIPGTESVQFMIIESYGYITSQEPQLLLNSDFHQV